eukprot:COSAG03_NODE_4080_length_1695_cov_2.140977_1_plen_104_part_00
MWCTVVECLLQCDPRNVMVAVDLENCFNAIDRDALVEELRRLLAFDAWSRAPSHKRGCVISPSPTVVLTRMCSLFCSVSFERVPSKVNPVANAYPSVHQKAGV